MARVHGKDLVYLDVDDTAGSTHPFLTYTKSLDFTVSAETHDTTTLGDDWKEFTGGLLGGDNITMEMMYDNAASTGTYDFFVKRLIDGRSGTLKWNDGTRTTSVETLVTSVSQPISVADMMMVTVTHQMTGAVTVS